MSSKPPDCKVYNPWIRLYMPVTLATWLEMAYVKTATYLMEDPFLQYIRRAAPPYSVWSSSHNKLLQCTVPMVAYVPNLIARMGQKPRATNQTTRFQVNVKRVLGKDEI